MAAAAIVAIVNQVTGRCRTSRRPGNGRNLAILQLLLSLLVLVDEAEVELCHFTLGHTEYATCVVRCTPELSWIKHEATATGATLLATLDVYLMQVLVMI